jgi:hypothetical protein
LDQQVDDAPAIAREHAITRSAKWVVGVFAVSSLLPAAAIAVNEILTTFSLGERVLPQPARILGAVALAAIAVPAVAVLLASVALKWRFAGLAVISLIGGILGLVGGVICALLVRWHALEAASEQGAEIAFAVERYEAARGEYPAQLTDLVPEFLDAVPETGLRDARAYNYRQWAGPCPAGNAWHLSVLLENGVLLQRQMFYCPRQDHNLAPIDDVWKYTTFERVGAWVYEVTDLDD